MNLKVHHVWLCSISIFSWCCYKQDTTHLLRPLTFANTHAPTGSQEKKEKATSIQARYVKGTEEEFLFGVRKPSFSGIHKIVLSCQWLPGRLLFCYLFYFMFFLFLSYFLCYWVLFFSYLIPTFPGYSWVEVLPICKGLNWPILNLTDTLYNYMASSK